MKKTLGILQCDERRPDLEQQFGSYGNDFKRMANDSVSEQWQFSVWRCDLGKLPKNATECDAWIISGSKVGVYEELPWINPLMEFVRQIQQAKRPLVGICFGHQLIHQALGGTVTLYDGGWGLSSYPIQAQQSFKGFEKDQPIKILAMHQDQVLQTAPNFEVLAGSDFCRNGITFDGCSIFTIQAHPEFVTDEFIALCEKLREDIDDTLINDAIERAHQSNDHHTLRPLISKFLAGKHRWES